jgi:hypothetical protein
MAKVLQYANLAFPFKLHLIDSHCTQSHPFPSKTWFFGIYLNFQWQKSLKNQYLPHSKSKSY